MKRVRFVRAARDELDAAMAWYDDRSPGLGLDLLIETRRTLELLARFPGVGTPVPRVRAERGTFRASIHRFPYAIVYRDRGEELEIVAIAHASRRPGYWRGR